MGEVDPVANGIVDVVVRDKCDVLATPVGWDDSAVENKELRTCDRSCSLRTLRTLRGEG
jgi:hypothetical protein